MPNLVIPNAFFYISTLLIWQFENYLSGVFRLCHMFIHTIFSTFHITHHLKYRISQLTFNPRPYLTFLRMGMVRDSLYVLLILNSSSF